MMSDGRKINEYILNPQIEFKVKRILSLYIICFNFNQCLFKLNGWLPFYYLYGSTLEIGFYFYFLSLFLFFHYIFVNLFSISIIT